MQFTFRKMGVLAPLTLFTAAFICAFFLSTRTVIDERHYATEAFDLYRHGRIPRIYPLLPTVSSVFLTVFGVTKASFILAPFLTGLLSVFLTYMLSKEIFGDESRAVLGSWLVACNPLLIWLSARHMTEALFTCMLTFTMLLLCKTRRSFGLSLSAGLSSLLTYLSRYPGILLFPYIMAVYIAQKRPLRILLAFVFSLVLLAVYWAVNALTSGVALTTELYSFSTLLGKTGAFSLHLSAELLANMLTKSFMGLALLLGYSLPFFRHVKIRAISGVHSILLSFIALYSFLHVGYYAILSLSWGFAWSVDHFARYLLPVSPLVFVYARWPSSRRSINLLVALSSTVVGVSLGLYLAFYSSYFSQVPVAWEEFLQGLVAR